MTTKVAGASVRTQSNSLRSDSGDIRSRLDGIRTRSAKAGIDANRASSSADAEDRAECLSLIREALKRSGMSQKEMAINARCSESQLADGLNGVRNFSVDWLWTQPNKFWLELRELTDQAKQLTPENKAAARAERIGELVRLLLEVAA